MYEIYEMYEISRERRFKLKSAYSNWVHEILNSVWNDQLWNGFQVTFMFNHIAGGFDKKCDAMEDEIDRCTGLSFLTWSGAPGPRLEVSDFRS
jgi:hypothetical protein